jgi:hypothetical protein
VFLSHFVHNSFSISIYTMGRRRKKNATTAAWSQSEKGSSSSNRCSVLLLEYLDLLVSLFGLAGLYNNNNSHENDNAGNDDDHSSEGFRNVSRRRLVTSLENLSMLLMKVQQQHQQVSLASRLPSPNHNVNTSSGRKNQTNARSSSSLMLDEFSLLLLLQLEEQLVTVREQINVVLKNVIARDRAETIHIKREIEQATAAALQVAATATTATATAKSGDTMDDHGCSSTSERVWITWTLVATRLAAAILQELHVEESLVRSFQQSLDSFYSNSSSWGEIDHNDDDEGGGGGGGSALLNMIRHAGECLNHHQTRSKLSNSLFYQEAAALLSQVITTATTAAANDDDDDDGSSTANTATANSSSWTRLSYYAATSISMVTEKQSSGGSEAVLATTTTTTPSSLSSLDPMRRLRLLDHTLTKTPLDVLREFCAPFRSNSSSGSIHSDGSADDMTMMMMPRNRCCSTTVIFLLIVGSEGSGKSYACDEMERFVSSTMEERDNHIHGMSTPAPPGTSARERKSKFQNRKRESAYGLLTSLECFSLFLQSFDLQYQWTFWDVVSAKRKMPFLLSTAQSRQVVALVQPWFFWIMSTISLSTTIATMMMMMMMIVQIHDDWAINT